MRILSRSFVVTALTAVLSTSTAYSQHEYHAQLAGGHPTSVVPLIDGSQHPELISDQTAIRAFLLAVTEAPDAEPAKLARLHVKIARIGFSPSDTALFVEAIHLFHPTWSAYQAQTNSLYKQIRAGGTIDTSTTARMVAIVGQVDQLIESTYTSLLAKLSPDGASRLKAHINFVKTKIKVIPPPQMPGGSQ